MPAPLLYLLKLSISLSVAWLFYRLVLRNLTFYRLNRWYLLGYTLLSFCIPFINIGPIATDADQVHQPFYLQMIPVVSNYAPPAPTPLHSAPVHSPLNPWSGAAIVLLVGMAIGLTRMLLRMYALIRIRQQARLLSSDAGIHIYEVDEPITPFSFGNAIYINPQLHTEKQWEEIILHEYVHIRQRHTLDILLAEIVCILNWYNPFAWALRHSIRQNLEFIADQQVLDNGVDKKEYQYHLLHVMGHPRYRLANNFNFSSLKKRIIMMNKIRSARLQLLRFLFLLPLLAVILLAFRGRYPQFGRHQTDAVFVNAAGIVIALPAKTPLAGVTVQLRGSSLQTTTDAHGYYKLRIPVITDSVRIHLNFTKNGFEAGMAERFYPKLKTTTGFIDVAGLPTMAPHEQEFFMAVPGFEPQPVDPEYPDAAAELQRVLTENQQFNHQKALQKDHPDIGLFYVTEDKQRRMVIHTDGSVEKYGYPGTPALAAMDDKYGVLPFMGPQGANTNKGYLDRWAAISARAEKEFHPTGGAPRAIIFPGDSRVIAVDAAGKAQIYDMDNTVDPKERRGFEQLYGKLPPCVPENGTVPPAIIRPVHQPAPAAGNAATQTAPAADTVPGNSSQAGEPHLQLHKVSPDSTNVLTLPHDIRIFLPKKDPIYVVNGRIMPDSINTLARINQDDIESIQVLKSETAAAQYGYDAHSRGVILITLKKTLNLNLKNPLDLKTDPDAQKAQKQP